MNATNGLVIGLVLLLGSLGSVVSAFIGDSGWHLPRNEDGIFRPGFLGNMVVGALAALASWGMENGSVLIGASASRLSFSTSDMANALVVGFGGASWFKGQIERVILQRAAVVAAAKPADPEAAGKIATCSPIEALRVAKSMRS